MIHENLHGSPSQIEVEDLTNVDSGVQYNVGQSQKFAVHIPTFLQRNEGDPAVKVSDLISFSASAQSYVRCRTFS
jgi:hypothetical protein